MGSAKNELSKYWVENVNRLLAKLQLETVKPEDFNTVIVQNTDEVLNITVLCNSKMLVLTLNQTDKKLSGGWKHF